MRNDNNKAYIRGVRDDIKMSLSEIIKCIAFQLKETETGDRVNKPIEIYLIKKRRKTHVR